MRIAHFIQRYPPAIGGSEAYFARLSRFCVAVGHAVDVWTSTAFDLEAFWYPDRAAHVPEDAPTQLDGVTVRRFRPITWPGRRYILKALSLLPLPCLQTLTLPVNPIMPGMWSAVSRPTVRYDLVHASAFPYAFPLICAQRLARRLGVPFVLTPFLHLGDLDDPHDRTRWAYTRPALARLLRQADLIFTQTPSERAAVLASGVAPERVLLQGLGVEVSDCTGGDRVSARRAWGIAEEDVVIGHLANLSAEKGSIDLVRAFLAARERNSRLRLVSAGPQMPNFRSFYATLPNKTGIVLVGKLTAQEKRDFFAAIDVFALPSRSDSFGLVLLEAWANGLPNIAYRAGGIADLIRHETDGLLIKCGDLPALTTGLLRLAADPTLRQDYGSAGRSRLSSEFAWPPKLALVMDAYRRLTCSAEVG